MFDGRWRERVDRRTSPIGGFLVRVGVTADVLTASGLVFAVATAVAVGTGHLLAGIPLLILTGVPDLFDGPVAKAAGTASMRGAFFDSVTDRVSDAVLMGGVMWYLVSTGRGHLALLPLAVLGVSSLISYERAKSEALGISVARGGLMERAERMILLGVGFLASWLLVPVLWALLGLTALTAVGRFVRVWQAAEGPVRRAAADQGTSAPRWRQGRVDSRWRAWREGSVPRSREVHSGEPSGRWRARRQEALASRTGRALRARRTTQRSGGRMERVGGRRSSPGASSRPS
ncbi:MAG: CDP-alcohol phosphatidyltransferase family protein [Actinomycetota bacterium]|nr:CDP-alcohol phosphatidyltransferase family protein [Actinomycetota bacterium]